MKVMDRASVLAAGEEEGPAMVSVDDFRSAFRLHPAGVAVITADSGDSPVAMTVSSLSSVSTEPLLLSFSASSLSSSTPALMRSESVVVHMIGTESLWLAKLGATSGVDRFADEAMWSRLPSGEPVFSGVHAWMRGRVVNRIEAGNASIFVVEVIEVSLEKDAQGSMVDATEPVVYHSRTWHRLGDHSAV